MVRQEHQIPSSMKLVASDASDKGFAVINLTCAKLVSHEHHVGSCGTRVMGRIFSESERRRSSTFRELLALFDFYTTFGPQLSEKAITHFTDNVVVTFIMQKGSNKIELQNMALSIYKTCKIHKIRLQVIWKRRSDPRIQLADEWSRAFDIESWGLTPREYAKVCSKFPVFTFDLFASEENAKCNKFASLIFSPSASARNAFTLNWKILGFCWTCPPTRLLGATLRQIVGCRAKGVLLAPQWTSLNCWHLFSEDGSHLNRIFLSVSLIFPVLQKGPYVTNEMFSGKPPFPMMLLRYDGSVSAPFSSSRQPSHCLLNGCRVCFRLLEP